MSTLEQPRTGARERVSSFSRAPGGHEHPLLDHFLKRRTRMWSHSLRATGLRERHQRWLQVSEPRAKANVAAPPPVPRKHDPRSAPLLSAFPGWPGVTSASHPALHSPRGPGAAAQTQPALLSHLIPSLRGHGLRHSDRSRRGTPSPHRPGKHLFFFSSESSEWGNPLSAFQSFSFLKVGLVFFPPHDAANFPLSQGTFSPDCLLIKRLLPSIWIVCQGWKRSP